MSLEPEPSASKSGLLPTGTNLTLKERIAFLPPEPPGAGLSLEDLGVHVRGLTELGGRGREGSSTVMRTLAIRLLTMGVKREHSLVTNVT